MYHEDVMYASPNCLPNAKIRGHLYWPIMQRIQSNMYIVTRYTGVCCIAVSRMREFCFCPCLWLLPGLVCNILAALDKTFALPVEFTRLLEGTQAVMTDSPIFLTSPTHLFLMHRMVSVIRFHINNNNNAPFASNIYKMWIFLTTRWLIGWAPVLKLLTPLRCQPLNACSFLAVGRETRSLIVNQSESAIGGIIWVIAVELVLVCDHRNDERFAVRYGLIDREIAWIPIKIEMRHVLMTYRRRND